MKNIVINNWQSGIGTSPYVGFDEIRNLDVTSKPGVARINFKAVKSSGTTITGLPLNIAVVDASPVDLLYVIDDDSKLYDNSGGWSETDSGGSGSAYTDMVLWKDYLMIARSLNFDMYGPLASSPDWDLAQQSIDASTYKPMLSAQDDKFYIGNGHFVSRFVENDGQTFDPATGATFTYTKEALDLPTNYEIIKLTELGRFLMVFANDNNGNGRMFPWDIANSATSFENPVSFGDEKINTAITVNNMVYVITGTENNIYKTDGVNVQWVGKLPEHLTGADDGGEAIVSPNAITHKGDRIFIGTASNSANEVSVVWSFNVITGAIVEEHTLSTGDTLSGTNIKCLVFANNQLQIGFSDSTASEQGVDIIASRRYKEGDDDYHGYIISPFYSVGSNISKSLWRPEVRLTRPQVAGDNIRLWFRTAQNGDWSEQIGEDWDVNNAQTKMFRVLPRIEMLQIKVDVQTSATTTTPELLEIILHAHGK